MEWIGIALGAIVIAVVAYLAGRNNGRNESKTTIGAYRTENQHLNKQVAELQAQVALYGPKKKKDLSPYASNRLKDALGSIHLPSFVQRKAKSSSVYGSSSRRSSYKPFSGGGSRSGGGGFFESFTLPAIISNATDSVSHGGGGYGGGDSGGSYGGGGDSGGSSCSTSSAD